MMIPSSNVFYLWNTCWRTEVYSNFLFSINKKHDFTKMNLLSSFEVVSWSRTIKYSKIKNRVLDLSMSEICFSKPFWTSEVCSSRSFDFLCPPGVGGIARGRERRTGSRRSSHCNDRGRCLCSQRHGHCQVRVNSTTTFKSGAPRAFRIMKTKGS